MTCRGLSPFTSYMMWDHDKVLGIGSTTAWAAGGALAAGLTAWTAPALVSARVLGSRARPRQAGRGRAGHVALTFDDGPDPQGTPAVLDALRELEWTATFFMLGSQVSAYPDVAREVVRAGHEVAVHGWEHRNHMLRTPGDVRQDLARAATEILETTGHRPLWFRPPYGVLGPGTIGAAKALQLQPILWTTWGKDWLPRTAQDVADTVIAHLRQGGTVLLHDSDCQARASQTWRATADSLWLIASTVRALGVAVGPLRDHFEP